MDWDRWPEVRREWKRESEDEEDARAAVNHLKAINGYQAAWAQVSRRSADESDMEGGGEWGEEVNHGWFL